MNTSFSLSNILRENIRTIKPYSTARDEYTGKALVHLDANENPFCSVDNSQNNRYPDPYQTELKKIVSRIKGIAPEHIFLGNGSDEAIDLLFRAVCNPGIDTTIICPPTYGMYEVGAATQDVQCIRIPLLANYELNTTAIQEAISPHTKILWLCSPNNPTGNILNTKDIEELLQAFPGIVVIDEAYIDFADIPSWITRLQEFPNLVVLQTFSKAWGLANIRLGMMFASTEIIAVIQKIKMPYNISGLVQEFAIQALQKGENKKHEMVKEIISERVKTVEAIQRIAGVETVYRSDANFILVKIANARKVYEYLLEKGIIVRDRSSVTLCENCLRITIGTPAENTVLLKEISAFSQLKN